jgi:hypothetical protein
MVNIRKALRLKPLAEVAEEQGIYGFERCFRASTAGGRTAFKKK